MEKLLLILIYLSVFSCTNNKSSANQKKKFVIDCVGFSLFPPSPPNIFTCDSVKLNFKTNLPIGTLISFYEEDAFFTHSTSDPIDNSIRKTFLMKDSLFSTFVPRELLNGDTYFYVYKSEQNADVLKVLGKNGENIIYANDKEASERLKKHGVLFYVAFLHNLQADSQSILESSEDALLVPANYFKIRKAE